MNKHRKPEPVKRDVRATARGVRVVTEFRGAKLKPAPSSAPPLQYVEDVCCRWCRGRKVAIIKTRERDRVYRCFECVDPETGEWTVFTVGTSSARA